MKAITVFIDVTFVWTGRASGVLGAFYVRLEEVHTRVHTAVIDVIVLDIVAHGRC